MGKKLPFFLAGDAPSLPVEIFSDYSGPKRLDAKFRFLVDSGATRCVLSKDICDAIDLDFNRGQEGTIDSASGGRITGRNHPVYFRVDGFPQWPVSVLFSDQLKVGNFDGVLGLQGFFDHFRVGIDTKNRIVNLSLHKK